MLFPITSGGFRRVAPSMEQAAPREAVIDVSVESLQSIAELESAWKELATRAPHSFYLSWLWIGTWLRHLPQRVQPYVLVARSSSRILGLAIICRRRAWSFGPHSRARWLLNETGDAGFDRLYIEYNGILADRSSADAVRAACLMALTDRLPRRDQLVLSGIDPELELPACRTADLAGLVTEVKVEDRARWVDFAQIREKGGNYRAALGRSTRQSVSRAMRLYAERGYIQFRTMQSTSDALEAFDLLASLHQARWGFWGSFGNPSFRRFHEDLIASGVPTGAVRISRTLAGDQTIGVLYNFVHNGRVLNYQSGFVYERDGRLKPGLVSHVLAIEDSIARGESGYDFLAGPAGHKSRLANAEHPLKWIAIGRDTPERRVEAQLRRAKRALATTPGVKRVLGTIASKIMGRQRELPSQSIATSSGKAGAGPSQACHTRSTATSPKRPGPAKDGNSVG
jgi:CelD/BcsL family acetyltransferase involved in cellulose biosynthesis